MSFKKTFKILSAILVLVTLGTFVGALDKSQKSEVISGISPTVFTFLNRNETVQSAQEKLTELGIYDGNISGLFGFKTRDAILIFQEQTNIPRTGILDLITQQKLFNYSTQDPSEYVVIDNTDYGNSFLYEWVNYTYGNPGEIVKLQGLFNLSDVSFNLPSHDLVSENNETYYVNQENETFLVKNISENSLASFNGKNVTAIGYLIEDENLKYSKTLFINYVTENSLQEDYPFVPYTKEGNEDLKNWINKNYDEDGYYVDVPGHMVFVEDSMVYGEQGNPSNIILVGYNEKFTIENISGNDLKNLIKQGVTVRGFLLSERNEKGYYTIVVNYLN
jgi:peptidoglycan hydrolase-like protein with peptidoglycan-binding domain